METLKKNTVTQEMVDDMIESYNPFAFDGKTLVVICKLKNGFTIVESSSCVDPENFDAEIGLKICIDKIKDKVWELLGFELQQKLYLEGATNEETSSTPQQDN